MPPGVMTFEKFNKRKQAAYLKALRAGHNRTTACKEAGVSYPIVWGFRKENPEFAEQEDRAEIEACGLIQAALFNSALGGNVTAQQVWLYNRDPEHWQDKRQPVQAIQVNVEQKQDERRETSPAEIADALCAALEDRADNPGDSSERKPGGSPMVVPAARDGDSRSVAG